MKRPNIHAITNVWQKKAKGSSALTKTGPKIKNAKRMLENNDNQDRMVKNKGDPASILGT